MAVSIAPFAQKVTPRVFQSETTTLLAAMTSQPTLGRQNVIDDLIAALKTAEVWTKLDFLHVMAAHDAQAARVNWKNPAVVGTEVATVTFTANVGYQGDGVSGHIDTGLSYNGGSLSQNDAHVGAWCANEAAGIAANTMIGTVGIARLMLAPRISNNMQSRLNNSTITSIANTISKGHYITARSVSTGYDVYKNGALLGSAVQTSAVLAASNFTYLRTVANYNSSWQIAAGHGGTNLTSTEIADLYSALSIYMTAVGSMINISSDAASSVVNSLKSQPALIAVIVLNVAMLAVLVFFMRDITKAVESNRNQLLDMVARCLERGGAIDKTDREGRP